MDNISLTDQIIKNTKSAGKTYSFDERHKENAPVEFWFQTSDVGLVLFIVFYTQACRWAKCVGCNLPSKSSKFHVDFKALIAQIDWIFRHPKIVENKTKIKKVIVSNNGSVLDQHTFSSTALMYLMAQLNIHLSNLAVLSLETRPEYVDIEELEFLARALKEGNTPTDLELAIGFEVFNDQIRNDIFNKGLSLKAFEDCVKKIAPFKFHLKCYFMQKPVPEMSDRKSVEDIKKGIDYLSAIAKKHGIDVNMHLNPTFVAFGTPLEKSFREGKYFPPKLTDVADAALHGRNKNITLFIGLYDEGLAVEGGSFRRKGDTHIVAEMERFNKSQNFDILQGIVDNHSR